MAPDGVGVVDHVLLAAQRAEAERLLGDVCSGEARSNEVALGEEEARCAGTARPDELPASQIWKLPTRFTRVFLHILNPFPYPSRASCYVRGMVPRHLGAVNAVGPRPRCPRSEAPPHRTQLSQVLTAIVGRSEAATILSPGPTIAVFPALCVFMQKCRVGRGLRGWASPYCVQEIQT